MWNGENVLLRIASSDMDFLDDRPRRVKEWLGLTCLRRNPFLVADGLDATANAPHKYRAPLGVAASSFPISTRCAAASWILLEEEKLHGRLRNDMTRTVREKMSVFRTDKRTRQFLRRSKWSTRKEFERMLRVRDVILNPIENEWLMRRVLMPEDRARYFSEDNGRRVVDARTGRHDNASPTTTTCRIDHDALWDFVTRRRRRRGRVGSRKKKVSSRPARVTASTLNSPTNKTWLQPMWESTRAKQEAKRAMDDIARLTRSVDETRQRIEAIEASLATCDSSSASSTTGHEIRWRRNQLFKQKVKLESEIESMRARMDALRIRRRQCEAHEATANMVMRGRNAMRELRSQYKELNIGADRTLSANEKLERFREADRKRRERVKNEERRALRERSKDERRQRRRDAREAIRRAVQYKAFRAAQKQRASAHVSEAVRVANDVTIRASQHATFCAQRVRDVVGALSRGPLGEDVQGICVCRRHSVDVPVRLVRDEEANEDRSSSSSKEWPQTIRSVVLVYDDSSSEDAAIVNTASSVMTLSLPSSTGFTVIVVPELSNESNRRALRRCRGKPMFRTDLTPADMSVVRTTTTTTSSSSSSPTRSDLADVVVSSLVLDATAHEDDPSSFDLRLRYDETTANSS